MALHFWRWFGRHTDTPSVLQRESDEERTRRQERDAQLEAEYLERVRRIEDEYVVHRRGEDDDYTEHRRDEEDDYNVERRKDKGDDQ